VNASLRGQRDRCKRRRGVDGGAGPTEKGQQQPRNQRLATDQDLAKHTAVRRRASAVNHWGQLGTWAFLPSYDPQRIESQLASL
jgi:hypothetical protein